MTITSAVRTINPGGLPALRYLIAAAGLAVLVGGAVAFTDWRENPAQQAGRETTRPSISLATPGEEPGPQTFVYFLVDSEVAASDLAAAFADSAAPGQPVYTHTFVVETAEQAAAAHQRINLASQELAIFGANVRLVDLRSR